MCSGFIIFISLPVSSDFKLIKILLGYLAVVVVTIDQVKRPYIHYDKLNVRGQPGQQARTQGWVIVGPANEPVESSETLIGVVFQGWAANEIT